MSKIVIAVPRGRITKECKNLLLKTSFAMPVYFAVSQESFDNTVTNFAQTLLTFDDTTP